MSPLRKNLKPAKKVKKGTAKRLLNNFFAHKIKLIIIVVCILGATIASTATNVYIKILIDSYIMPLIESGAPYDFSPLLKAIFTFVVVLITGVLCSITYKLLMVKVSNGILRDIREQMYHKMQYFPIRYFDTNKAGDVMSRYTNDLDTFRQVISQSIPAIVMGVFTTISVVGSMIVLSINLFIIVAIMCILMYLFTKFVGNVTIKSYRATQKAVGDLNSYVEEMVRGAKEVKVYCYEERNIKVFHEKNRDWGKAVISADTPTNLMMPIMNSIGNILYVLIAFIGGYMALNGMPNFTIFGTGVLTLGTISSFLTFTKSFSHMIAEFSTQVPFVMQSLSGAERIFDLIDTDVEKDDGKVVLENDNDHSWHWYNPTNDTTTKQNGDIILENVNFSYVSGKQVLKNINVYANRGETVALVGATGAGKTTITNLINRFYDIDDGVITIDGIDIKNIKKKDLRSSMSLVLQDVHLFTGTILDNIRYGKLDATDEECIAAAKLASADPFIMMLPDGYNTMLKGEAGGLSQGQKQLISIARAAVADPPCLILDEATSSIDTRTEKLVQKAISSIMKGRTTFVIAHRLSTIKDADVIMVMQDGEIIERGTHASLLEKKGHYYELYTGKVEMD